MMEKKNLNDNWNKGSFRYEDPAFAMVGLSRVSHTVSGEPNGPRGARLFGSDVDHQHYIVLRVSPAEVDHYGSQDWFHKTSGHSYVEVALSNTQFADLLTSFNVGDGVPCTLLHKDGKSYAMPDVPTKSEQFRDDLSDDLRDVLKDLREAEKEILEAVNGEKAIGKTQQKELLFKLRGFSKLVDDHLPFLAKQFQRFADRTVNEAKANVEAYVDHTVRTLGLEKLDDLAKMIEKKE
jgi:hypothetical protein